MKPEVAGRARWYASRGYPHNFIAEKLGVHRNTVRAWCDPGATNQRSIDRLVLRLRKLPAHHLQEILIRIDKARRVA